MAQFTCLLRLTSKSRSETEFTFSLTLRCRGIQVTPYRPNPHIRQHSSVHQSLKILPHDLKMICSNGLCVTLSMIDPMRKKSEENRACKELDQVYYRNEI